MTQRKKIVSSALLRALADAIDELDEREFAGVLSAAGLQRLAQDPQTKRSNASRSVSKDEEMLANEIMLNLTQTASREAAHELIKKYNPNRRVLVKLAKMRDVHIVKQDNGAIVVEKLVENIVGSRLDSEAIRFG